MQRINKFIEIMNGLDMCTEQGWLEYANICVSKGLECPWAVQECISDSDVILSTKTFKTIEEAWNYVSSHTHGEVLPTVVAWARLGVCREYSFC